MESLVEGKEVVIVIVGAGPVGLLLAAELKLAGANPMVLEKRVSPSGEPRARGIGPLATEALIRRGLGERLAEHDKRGRADKLRDHGSPNGHFAAIFKIPEAAQEEPDRLGTLVWQADLEAILREYVEHLGVSIRYGTEVTAIRQDEDSVTVNEEIRAAYVVGCDGGRSTVRKLAGFDFPGTPPLMTVRRVPAKVDGLLPPPGRFANGFFNYGHGLVSTFDFKDVDTKHEGPVTAEEMAESIKRVTGVDVVVTDVGPGLRFTDQARQVSHYQMGRVLLAGDAAHVHSPMGGQGLNLGLMDAVNLGWKLAATVAGTAPPGLLATYHLERHPVGAAVLHNTRAQSALMRPGPHTDALRDVFSELMDIPEVVRYLGRMMSGLGIQHKLPYRVGHPLAGTYCPDLRLTLANGEKVRLSDLTRNGGHVLLGAPGGTDVTSTGRGDLAAALIRPDGIVAWAAAPGESFDGLAAALATWLGQ